MEQQPTQNYTAPTPTPTEAPKIHLVTDVQSPVEGHSLFYWIVFLLGVALITISVSVAYKAGNYEEYRMQDMSQYDESMPVDLQVSTSTEPEAIEQDVSNFDVDMQALEAEELAF